MAWANGPTINNFLAFLIEFSFSILFLIVFSAIHFTLITKTKLKEKLQTSKAISFWYFFAVGAILSLITFIVSQATSASISTTLTLPVTILAQLVALTFFYNRSVIVGATIPSIFWVLIYNNGFDGFSWGWCSKLIVVLIIIVVSFSSTFFKTKKWPTYLISLFVIAAACVAVTALFWDAETWLHITEYVLAFASAIVFYWIISKLNNFYNTMNYMAKTNLYTDEGYIIPSKLDDQFESFVKKNNISQALVVTFYSENLNKKLLENLVKNFKSDKSLLFKTTYGTYGVVLCDNLYHITNIKLCCDNNNQQKRLIPDPLAYLENEINRYNLLAFVSVYGVHSNDLNELIRFNQYAIKQYDRLTTINHVQFFDSNMLNNILKDEVNFAQLSQKIKLDEIDIQLETIKFKNRKQKYICPRFYWTKMYTCDINTILKNFNQTTSNALLRHLAIKSIEAYCISNNPEKLPLIIYYPINELTNQYFSTSQFIKKIQLYGVNKSDVILSFDCKKMKIWPNVVINNLKELQDYDVKYMLIDLANTYPLTLLKPSSVILDKSIEKDKVKLNKTLALAKQYKQNILLNK